MSFPDKASLILYIVLFAIGFFYLSSRLIYARKHGLSIRLQVFLALSVSVFFVMSTFGLIVIDRLQSRAILFTYRAAKDDAQIVSSLVHQLFSKREITSLSQPELTVAQSVLRFTTGPDDMRVQLVDLYGTVQFDSLKSAKSDQRIKDIDVFVKALPEDKPIMREATVIAVVGIYDSNNELIGLVKVSKPIFSMLSVITDLGPKIALLALMLALVAAIASIIIGHSVALPVERLTKAAKRIASGERQATLPMPRGREVKALTMAFEKMRRELEEREAMETFVADLSHELKNPVAAIRASAEVLEYAIDDDIDAAKSFVAQISESSKRLSALIEDLLRLAKLEAQDLTRDLELLDLKQLLQTAVNAQRAAADAKSLKIDLDVVSIEFMGHKTWLLRAVTNLLSNAVVASPIDGTVKIVAKRFGSYCHIFVADNGPGVRPQIEERIFERFVTTRHETGGTGLGLAIVRAVAETHGGQAYLAQNSSNGATFCLEVPVGTL